MSLGGKDFLISPKKKKITTEIFDKFDLINVSNFLPSHHKQSRKLTSKAEDLSNLYAKYFPRDYGNVSKIQ